MKRYADRSSSPSGDLHILPDETGLDAAVDVPMVEFSSTMEFSISQRSTTQPDQSEV